MKAKNVLIVTNRPSIANSWYDDFDKYMAGQSGYCFVSDNDSLKGRQGVMTWDMFQKWFPNRDENFAGQICFESLQGLKGSVYFGGNFDKLEWIKNLQWDLLIVDESHEGVKTMRTDRAFNNIQRRFTLYLSGTPFKAIASGEFGDHEIFNWSYTDEQEAKENWSSDDHNPYENLPRLNLFTYRMSDIVREKVKQGMELDEEGTIDYAFDLNEFFKTKEDGTFEHEPQVRKFLQALTTQEKFPFATEELRKEMAHTLWLLPNRVDCAKAMAKLLKEEGSGFKDYEIVLAAGDGKLEDNDETVKAYNKVKKAIKNHDKTITLSIGQLTTGVTIPEWSGVLMLSNVQSAQLYMQAAFRVQNPYEYSKGGKITRKDNAYVFDFDPARTLMLYDEFANNLKKSTAGGNGLRIRIPPRSSAARGGCRKVCPARAACAGCRGGPRCQSPHARWLQSQHVCGHPTRACVPARTSRTPPWSTGKCCRGTRKECAWTPPRDLTPRPSEPHHALGAAQGTHAELVRVLLARGSQLGQELLAVLVQAPLQKNDV